MWNAIIKITIKCQDSIIYPIIFLIMFLIEWVLFYTLIRYKITIPVRVNQKSCNELLKWTNEYCRFNVLWITLTNLKMDTITMGFRYEEDAMAFKLRWL